MAKIHAKCPVNRVNSSWSDEGDGMAGAGAGAMTMTVWRKSLLLNCKGFTVYDGEGDLLFRVDNYSSSRNGEIVLMDANGKCLFTIKRKRLSIGEKWLIYHGEEATKPQFSVKKHMNFLHYSKVLAQVTSSSSPNDPRNRRHSYSIEGSYSHNQCTIYDDRRRPVGEVKRKEAAAGIALGCDVFQLVVQSELDAPLAMAMVVILEQMYGS